MVFGSTNNRQRTSSLSTLLLATALGVGCAGSPAQQPNNNRPTLDEPDARSFGGNVLGLYDLARGHPYGGQPVPRGIGLDLIGAEAFGSRKDLIQNFPQLLRPRYGACAPYVRSAVADAH